MKRRNFLKSVGAGALPLAGLERLVRAMVSPQAITAPVECPEEEASFNYEGGNPYACNNFECARGGNQQTFICNPTDSNEIFKCVASFHGCYTPGDFYCEGTDPVDSQFKCCVDFAGCFGEGGVFRCDDFKCEVHYICSSDKSNTCHTNYPFYCSNRYTA